MHEKKATWGDVAHKTKVLLSHPDVTHKIANEVLKVSIFATIVGILITFARSLKVKADGELRNCINDIRANQARIDSLQKELNGLVSKYKSMTNAEDTPENQKKYKDLVVHYMKCKKDIYSIRGQLRSSEKEIYAIAFKSEDVKKETVDATKEKIAKLYEKIESIDSDTKNTNESYIDNLVNNFGIAIFEMYVNGLIPEDKMSDLIATTEKALDIMYEKVTETKLSIYEHCEESKITESEKIKLLTDMESHFG